MKNFSVLNFGAFLTVLLSAFSFSATLPIKDPSVVPVTKSYFKYYVIPSGDFPLSLKSETYVLSDPHNKSDISMVRHDSTILSDNNETSSSDYENDLYDDYASLLDDYDYNYNSSSSDYDNDSSNLVRDLLDYEDNRIDIENSNKEEMTQFVGVNNTDFKKLREGCGFYIQDNPFRSSRIVGGVPIEPHKFPWVVSLYYRHRFRCGGSMITSNFVLTAAHCVHKSDPRLLKVKALNMVENVHKYYIHPKFWILSHDAALIKLEKKFDFPLPPVCITNVRTPQVGQTVVIIGRGSLKENELPSTNLHSAEVQILPDKKCEDRYTNYFNPSFMCAGDPSGIPDTCQGDSGGPLIKKVAGNWYQIGIVSYGDGCGRPDSPGVYTKISLLFEWIEKLTSEE